MFGMGPLEPMLSEGDKALFVGWSTFLEERVDFTDFGSELHTRNHCARVLMYAIVISGKMGMDARWREALCLAAVFHDCRRQDDGLDVGHGDRAAEHYMRFCEEHDVPFYQTAYLSMKYHDKDDALGEEAIRSEGLGEDSVLLYRVLKDADALDRFRLGPDGLDPAYIRTVEAVDFVETAKAFSSPGRS